MPKEVYGRNFQFLSQEELLTYEEIETIAQAFHARAVLAEGWVTEAMTPISPDPSR